MPGYRMPPARRASGRRPQRPDLADRRASDPHRPEPARAPMTRRPTTAQARPTISATPCLPPRAAAAMVQGARQFSICQERSRSPLRAQGLGPRAAQPQRILVCYDPLLRQRIGPHLNLYGARLRALDAFLQPRRAVDVRAPKPAALTAGITVVVASVQSLGKEAQRIRDAQHDHLPVLERGEAVIEIGGRDRDVLAEPHRVVVVHPGVVARLGAPVLEALEGRAR